MSRGDGQLSALQSIAGGPIRYTFFPHYEVSVQGTEASATRSYFFGGARIAQKVGSGALTWLHGDHLGSTVLTTGVNGSKQYHAYGSTRSGSVPTEWQYTGQEQDSTGLVYLHARYYDPLTGQFLSPDTIVPDPSDVFSYNRFMYARGNPLRYSDPSGHCVFGIDTIFCVIAAFAVAGGAAGFGGNVIGQGYEQWDEGESWEEYKDTLDISWTEAGIAATAGAIGSGAAPVTGPVGFAVVNAVAGAGQQVATDVIVDGQSFGDSITDPSLIAAATISGAGALITGPASKAVSHVVSGSGEAITYATGPYARAVGGEWFAENTGEMLVQQQLAEATSSRGLVAGFIANLPLPDWMTSWWPWTEESDEDQ